MADGFSAVSRATVDSSKETEMIVPMCWPDVSLTDHEGKVVGLDSSGSRSSSEDAWFF
jgi:hypothetical protein